MWRSQGNAHKFRTNRCWQALRDYLLWGFPVTCAYLNKKLSDLNDKRPLWKYKHSLVTYTQQHAPSLGLTKRRPIDIPDQQKKKLRRNRPNPFKCELGKKRGRSARLKAAQYCERTMGRRMVNISDYFNKSQKHLRCARCGDFTSWACLSCGAALCVATSTSTVNPCVMYGYLHFTIEI